MAACVLASVTTPALAASTAAEVDLLRQQFPVGSIDSVPRADAALGATAGAKARVEKDYKATARDCMKTILVNDCLDRARLLQQKRLADIDAVELEANRYKRRDHADKLDADRSQREAERQARAPADADQREKNRKTFDDKQGQAARDVADRPEGRCEASPVATAEADRETAGAARTRGRRRTAREERDRLREQGEGGRGARGRDPAQPRGEGRGSQASCRREGCEGYGRARGADACCTRRLVGCTGSGAAPPAVAGSKP